MSAAFRGAIGQTHKLAVKIEVLKAGVPQILPDGSTELTSIEAGTVTLDATAASRGRMDVSLVDDGNLGLIPTSASSLLAPYGNELRISRGLRYPDGTIEAPAIGVFRIDESSISDTTAGLRLQLSGLDRSGLITRARFEDPFLIAQSTSVETAILSVIQPAFPTVQTVFPGAQFTTPLLSANEGEDRWAFAQQIATACGLELYFDGDGKLRLAPTPTSATPVATFAEGEGSVLIETGRDWKSAGAYNACIVTGENTSETAPARGIARDLNPLSPTYYYGSFGPTPFFFASQFIVTDAQAAAAATALLQSQLGTTQQVRFGVVVDPSLEPGDTVQITRQRSGIDEAHILNQITIPLSADQEMTGTTRAVTS